MDLGALLYANSLIGPARLTPQVFLNGFAKVFGRHPGFRKNHAKGVAVAGYFESNGNGRRLSKASVFRPGRTPVVRRFSLAGGNPHTADAPAVARGLVLPAGIEPSDDPLLSARSAVYSASYRRRTGETASPSAVQVDKVAL